MVFTGEWMHMKPDGKISLVQDVYYMAISVLIRREIGDECTDQGELAVIQRAFWNRDIANTGLLKIGIPNSAIEILVL
jgi:hypothetical protein